MGLFDGINWGQLGQDIINPYGAVARQVTGNAAIGNVINPTNAALGIAAGNAIDPSRKDPPAGAGMPASASATQAAADRNTDFATGQARWQQIVASNPEYAANMARYKDMSQGLNAQEMTAAREQMAQGQNSTANMAMRRLYSNQARSGVRGGMASAQAGRVGRQAMTDRNSAEQKLLLDNYALKAKGLEGYSNQVNAGLAGNLATGTGEAQLGVADRTNTYQQGVNAAMLAAQQNQRGGLLTQIFGGLI